MSFKNQHPDHQMSWTADAAYCSCGWRKNAAYPNSPEHVAGQHYAATRGHQPGQFRGRCVLGARVPLHTLSEAERQRAEAEDAELKAAGRYSDVFAYDRKAHLETARIPCELDTTDRNEYLTHMAQVHGKKPRGSAQLKRPKVGTWKGQPKLTEEGREFVADGKEIVRCECGLYGQLGTASSELWWREHVSMCAEKSAVA